MPATLWLPEQAPRCILQISHGMTEHIGRYTVLAQELSEYGIIVARFDLRGHRRNPRDRNIASFGKGSWEASIQDMRLFLRFWQNSFPGSHTLCLASL
ncbi:alpha/beta hydrolase [Anaerobutyricum hallii]|uniref:alpha/beta hydrolase n=1 Tax=Anaerobutyricum hallii TaxID=39488 RepID=UPI003FA47E42